MLSTSTSENIEISSGSHSWSKSDYNLDSETDSYTTADDDDDDELSPLVDAGEEDEDEEGGASGGEEGEEQEPESTGRSLRTTTKRQQLRGEKRDSREKSTPSKRNPQRTKRLHKSFQHDPDDSQIVRDINHFRQIRRYLKPDVPYNANGTRRGKRLLTKTPQSKRSEESFDKLPAEIKVKGQSYKLIRKPHDSIVPRLSQLPAKYNCSVDNCTKSFPTASALVIHLRTEEELAADVGLCPYCGKICEERGAINQCAASHLPFEIDHIDKGQFTYGCLECLPNDVHLFPAEEYYMSHLVAKHGKVFYKCVKCNTTYHSTQARNTCNCRPKSLKCVDEKCKWYTTDVSPVGVVMKYMHTRDEHPHLIPLCYIRHTPAALHESDQFPGFVVCPWETCAKKFPLSRDDKAQKKISCFTRRIIADHYAVSHPEHYYAFQWNYFKSAANIHDFPKEEEKASTSTASSRKIKAKTAAKTGKKTAAAEEEDEEEDLGGESDTQSKQGDDGNDDDDDDDEEEEEVEEAVDISFSRERSDSIGSEPKKGKRKSSASGSRRGISHSRATTPAKSSGESDQESDGDSAKKRDSKSKRGRGGKGSKDGAKK